MCSMKCYLRASKSVAVLAATLGLSSFTFAAVINFDDVGDGTVINTHYSALGVTFNNPLGTSTANPDSPNIYSRSSTTNASPGNVVSVFSTGVPAFDARWGAVEAVFSTGQRQVSIEAAILRLPEGLSTPTNSPKLEVYNLANTLVASIFWDFTAIPQPSAGGITAFQTLNYTSTSDDIGKVRFLSGQPGNAPSNFGIFDNLGFTKGSTVAEPETLLLVSLGMLLVGGSRFLRRRTHRHPSSLIELSQI